MSKYFKIVLIIFSVCTQQLFCQSVEDFAFSHQLTKTNKKQSVGNTYKSEISNNHNEVEVIFSSLFFFYKTILSSQDQNVCSFYPSCSEFGIMSIKTKGLVKGGIMTFDRLTRCNGLSPGNYTIDYERRKLSDPVK